MGAAAAVLLVAVAVAVACVMKRRKARRDSTQPAHPASAQPALTAMGVLPQPVYEEDLGEHGEGHLHARVVHVGL